MVKAATITITFFYPYSAPYTGYGDLSATNVQEMIYAIAVMVAGKLNFGFILGSIASTLANLDTQRVLFEEKLSALKVIDNQRLHTCV